MSKGVIYKIDKNNGKKSTFNKNESSKEFIVGIIVYAVVLMIANFLFKGIYIENFIYAIIAALILSFLDTTIKPFLVVLTLPITIMSFGILYPIVNVILLNICDIIMGNSFMMGGFISSFIISLFISWLRIYLDKMITENVGE